MSIVAAPEMTFDFTGSLEGSRRELELSMHRFRVAVLDFNSLDLSTTRRPIFIYTTFFLCHRREFSDEIP